MDVRTLVERIAAGNRTQELTAGERDVSANRLFRIWGDTIKILKIYGSPARERRERHALAALRGLPGIPVIIDRGTDEPHHWAVFIDSGRWSLATLPENPGMGRQAGAILRRIHDTEPNPMSNLSRGIDQEWVAVDFVSTFRRLDRYRGRLGLKGPEIEAARAVRPPFASAPRASHTNPSPEHFLVDDEGSVTLINWEWATLAPPEWDLSKAVWLSRLRSGPAVADAIMEGYGKPLDRIQLDRWTVYHAGMILVYEAERRISGPLDGFADIVDELRRSVAGARPD